MSLVFCPIVMIVLITTAPNTMAKCTFLKKIILYIVVNGIFVDCGI